MTEVWLWLLPAGALGAHLAFGRYSARRTHAGWERLLRGEDLHAIDCEELLVQGDAACLTSSTKGSQQAHARGDIPEAVRLLALAYLVIEEAAPNRRERLEAMLRFSRMAVAVRVPEPLPAAAFQLRQLGLLAGVAWLLHHLLVAPAERFGLRVRVLLFGFRLAFRVLTKSRWAIERNPANRRAWSVFAKGAEDWKCLDRAHLETFKAYVESVRMVARPRGGA